MKRCIQHTTNTHIAPHNHIHSYKGYIGINIDVATFTHVKMLRWKAPTTTQLARIHILCISQSTPTTIMYCCARTVFLASHSPSPRDRLYRVSIDAFKRCTARNHQCYQNYVFFFNSSKSLIRFTLTEQNHHKLSYVVRCLLRYIC